MSITLYQDFHEKNLGLLIFNFLPRKDCENLGLANKAWRKAWRIAKINFDILNYQYLHNAMSKITDKKIYIRDEKGMHEEIPLSILGSGGSKIAIELEGGRALMVPKMGIDPIRAIVMRWKRMADEEVCVSEILNKIGLPSLSLKRVSISFSLDSKEGEIPTYLSETFNNLKEQKNWFIIDRKNSHSSTWKFGENFLFNSEEERFNEKNWDYVVASLLTDIEKICIYQIPIDRDSINIAILKKPSELNISQYEVRFFGFDFSSKSGSIPILEDLEFARSNFENFFEFDEVNKQIEDVLKQILTDVFIYEFEESGYYDKKNAWVLKNKLIEKYTQEVLSKIQSNFQNSN